MSYHLYLYRRVGQELHAACDEVPGFERQNIGNLRAFFRTLPNGALYQIPEPGPHPELFVVRPHNVPDAKRVLSEVGGNTSLGAVLSAMEHDPELFMEVSN